MKITRYKKVHKYLSFYMNNYQFRPPFQVLIDGTFCFAALQEKFNIQDQLPKYFQQETKLLTTPCVIMETEKLGQRTHGAMLIVKKFPVHRCSHEKHPTTGSKCLRSMIKKGNPSRYIIATQDRELQEKLRELAGTPLLYLHGKVPTLDPPSQASKDNAQNRLGQVFLKDYQMDILKELKQTSGLLPQDETKVKKKKKKGPNPLSCKKKQKKSTITVNSKASGKVRKRRKTKIPSHVKKILKTETNKE
ncbi:rRNA-processing protein UTP23 homolog [Fopius arisanus]|uniref:rRNA-processing protein UTP23 homolog n=1 Tax=Fopius arisanus TaxID=64838 RepID=A0A9R1TL08_9HYME|nr:PREDICTED: rRNA-processing protein UTP23 homolog [Fopius arisanus]